MSTKNVTDLAMELLANHLSGEGVRAADAVRLATEVLLFKGVALPVQGESLTTWRMNYLAKATHQTEIDNFPGAVLEYLKTEELRVTNGESIDCQEQSEARKQLIEIGKLATGR